MDLEVKRKVMGTVVIPMSECALTAEIVMYGKTNEMWVEAPYVKVRFSDVKLPPLRAKLKALTVLHDFYAEAAKNTARVQRDLAESRG